jgi:hypothetical protein
MISASLPTNSSGRLDTFRQSEVFYTAPEQQLDDLVLLASYICGAPITLIGLAGKRRQWLKTKIDCRVPSTLGLPLI